MSGAKRSAIRAAAEAQIQTALNDAGYTGTLFNGRRVDARDQARFINLTIESGTVEATGLQRQCRAELLVVLADASATDDQLDTLADTVDVGLYSDPSLGGEVYGINFVGWEFPPDEQQAFVQLALRYEVIYQP